MISSQFLEDVQHHKQLTFRASAVTLFCRNCGETAENHLDDKKCLFAASYFAYFPRAEVVKDVCEHYFKYCALTPQLRNEIEAYTKALFEELERLGVPE